MSEPKGAVYECCECKGLPPCTTWIADVDEGCRPKCPWEGSEVPQPPVWNRRPAPAVDVEWLRSELRSFQIACQGRTKPEIATRYADRIAAALAGQEKGGVQ